MKTLEKVIDPEIGCNIVELGLIYGVKVGDQAVNIDMTLTNPGCPLGQFIEEEARKEVKKIKGVGKVNINMVFDPPWTPERMTPDLRKRMGF